MQKFSENGQEWQPIPYWVEFLIQFGYRWYGNDMEQRRIAIVSMPCESAAAGLIALGALIRDLENPNTNDVGGHFNALLRYARQYLKACRVCNHRCNPKIKRCGYTAEATGWVRYWGRKPVKRYKISEKSELVKKRLLYSKKGGTWWQNPRLATDWQIDGEPPPQLANNDGELEGEIYTQIIESAKVLPENLQRSFAGLCFAGRVAGKTATYNSCASVCFHSKDSEYYLANLLTIHGWPSDGSVSRMCFFNSRTESFDRYTPEVSLVVADGDKSFLKVLGRTEFQRTDVIGAIHRIMKRDDLEAVGSRIHGLRQWYKDDSDTIDRLPPVPRGISIMILKRRTA